MLEFEENNYEKIDFEKGAPYCVYLLHINHMYRRVFSNPYCIVFPLRPIHIILTASKSFFKQFSLVWIDSQLFCPNTQKP